MIAGLLTVREQRNQIFAMTQDKQRRDNLFAAAGTAGDFVFDDKVAEVFDDMVNRSIPGYSTILSMIGVLAARYARPHSNIYDLGCSLGGASLAMANSITAEDCAIQAIDNSGAMIERLQQRLESKPEQLVVPRCEDILECEIENASIVVLNFTLQFVAPEQRQGLMDRIYQGLHEGGILIISEKIVVADSELNELLIELYHKFKENMGYSQLEISQKRTALENVLIPESLDQHRARMTRSGFRAFEAWFQCFNFASMIAFK